MRHGIWIRPEMEALIDAGRKKMDYVILDTPPMSVSSDAELMLKMADNAGTDRSSGLDGCTGDKRCFAIRSVRRAWTLQALF